MPNCVSTQIPKTSCIFKNKADVGKILLKFSERKGLEIIAAERCLDHIPMLVSRSPHISI